jgi:hypothetical protein
MKSNRQIAEEYWKLLEPVLHKVYVEAMVSRIKFGIEIWDAGQKYLGVTIGYNPDFIPTNVPKFDKE